MSSVRIGILQNDIKAFSYFEDFYSSNGFNSKFDKNLHIEFSFFEIDIKGALNLFYKSYKLQ